jgi:hypothetical protein
MSEKTERWAFARIRELEKELGRWRTKYWAMKNSRDYWRERFHERVRKTPRIRKTVIR